MEPRVTTVRYSSVQGQALLQAYLYGGIYGPLRVPRGIAPEVVLEFVQKRIPAEAEVDVFAKCLEVLRFYELPEALSAVTPALERLRNPEDLRRSAYVLQMVGDLGTSADGVRAATHLDTRLVPSPDAPPEFLLLLQTRLALTPHGSDAVLAARIHAEGLAAQRHAKQSEQGMMRADRLAAVERNDLPRMRAHSAAKVRLAELEVAARVQPLADSYLGRGAATGPYLEVWAARMLRQLAFTGALAPVVAAFGQVITSADPRQQGTRADFAIVRAAQAIVYLGGKLLAEWEAAYQRSRATGAAMNFLWDDP